MADVWYMCWIILEISGLEVVVVVVRLSVHVHFNMGLSPRVSYSRANEEMLDIMRRRAAVGTDVEACIPLDSAPVRAQESTISGSQLREG